MVPVSKIFVNFSGLSKSAKVKFNATALVGGVPPKNCILQFSNTFVKDNSV